MNDPDRLADPELDALLGDVVAGIDAQIEHDGAMPDLAAVVAMAHRLDPSRVPSSAVDEVADYAPVVPLREGRRMRQTRDDPAMDAVVAQVRAHVEQDIAARLHRPAQAVIPAANTPTPRRVWLSIAAAAAVLLMTTAGVLGAQRLIRDEPASDGSLVEQVHPPADAEQARLRGEPEPEPEAMPIVPVPPPAVPQLDASDSSSETQSKRSPRHSRRSAPDAPSLEERLARLDAAAHAAWRAGDLKTAEDKFGRIVELGGQRRIADLAYGDLFTLARQTHRPEREAKLWSAYLRRFPRGRFADDARAGTCRRAQGEARRTCWAAYLEESPKGAYRGQAKRELESGGP